jgi:hypothetical protein
MPAGCDPDLQKLSDDETRREKNSLAVRNGRLYFSYISLGGESTNFPDQILSCSLDTAEWGLEWAPGPNPPAGYSAICDEGQYSELLAAGQLGIIYKLEQALPETNQIAHRWTSGFFYATEREHKAQWADLVIEHSTQRSVAADQALTVKLKRDHGDSADVTLGSISVATTATGPGRSVTVLPVGVDGKGVIARNVAALVEGDCKHQVSLYSMTMHCYPFPRDARTFDTDRTNCGDPRVKDFDLMELDIFSNDDVAWSVSTDLPGNAMSERQNGTFPATGDRVPLPIPVVAEGRLIQIVLTSPDVFWLFGGRVRYRGLGVYLDGTQGNYWETAAEAVNL